MSQKKRSVTLSNTVYQWLEALVNSGEYSDLDDAATDLLMQVKRGTHKESPQMGLNSVSTTQVLESTTPVLTSTLKPLTSVGKNAMDELLSMEF